MIPKLTLLPHHKKLFDKLTRGEKADMLDALLQYINMQEVEAFENPAMDMLFSILTVEVETEDKRKYTSAQNGKKHVKNLNKKIGSETELASDFADFSPNPLIDNKNIIKEEIISKEVLQDNNIIPIRDNIIIPIKEENNKEEKDSRLNKSAMQKEEFFFADFAKYFNSKMESQAIPKICTLTKQRKAALRARAREHGEEALRTVADKMAASDFLNGKNSRGWVADFKWVFLHPNNFAAVLEGSYDNSTQFPRADRADPDTRDGTRLRQGEMNYTEGIW